MTLHALDQFPVSNRRSLRPGTTFKTIRGSGPVHNGAAVGHFGEFVCVRLYRRGRRRVYAEAIHRKNGTTHDLYINGPAYTSAAGTREKPYRIKLT